MTWILLAYAVAVLAIGAADARRTGSFSSYILADRKRSAALVAASILASAVGASATLGVVDLAYRVGVPAFWWLGSGGIGLVVCGLFLAPRIRSIEAVTLADLVQKTAGKGARRAVAAIVVVGWSGIVAAQFVAAAKVVGPMVGWGYGPSLLCASGVIVAYCILGGQISVMKTDALQLGVMLGGIGACIVALYARTGLPEGGLHVALVNVDFPISRFWYFMIVIGSGFVVGPDVYGRLFTARSPGAARRGALASGLALLVVSAAVVSIGVWARHFGKPPEGTGVLPWILKNELPVGLGGFLSLALLSAIISSADTCLMSAASTAEHDLLGGSRVGRTRLIAAGIGVVSLVIAGVEQDIISTMLLAYSLFNCGVIPPVAVAVLAWPRRRLSGRWVVAAIVLGGALGIAGKLGHRNDVTMLGVGLSLVLSLIALWQGASRGSEVDLQSVGPAPSPVHHQE